jgi:hypothetical protein
VIELPLGASIFEDYTSELRISGAGLGRDTGIRRTGGDGQSGSCVCASTEGEGLRGGGEEL